MKYKTLTRIGLHALSWVALAVVAYAEPLGDWLDEHHPIGGKK